MSELSFGIIDNNADFQQITNQLREAIDGLESDFATLYTNVGNSIKGIEQFINDLRVQIDSTIMALNKLDIENQLRLGNLQSSSLIGADISQEGAIQSEISARNELSRSIENQNEKLKDLGVGVLEYEEWLKQSKEAQKVYTSGLKTLEDQLNGTSGMFAVASGTMELFGVKNDFLQKAMQKVQAAIAVTNGLQAISTALSKGAVIQLNILGNVKLWWKGIVLQAAAAQGVETASAQVGAIANLGLAGSFRAVGLALKSIPVFGWIAVGISALVEVLSYWSSSTDEQIEKQNDLSQEINNFNNSVQNYAAKPIATLEILSNKFKALGDNMEAQKKFIIDNKSAFDELGLSIISVSDAQQLLIENKEKFIDAQIAKATSLAYADKVEEGAKKLIHAKTSAATWQKAADMRGENIEQMKASGIMLNRETTPLVENIVRQKYDQIKADKYNKDAETALADMKRNITLGYSESLKYDNLMSGFKKAKNLPKNTLSDEQEKQQQLDKLLSKQSLENERSSQDIWDEIWQEQIDAMDDGSEKTLAKMELNHEKQLQAIDREKEDLLLKRKEQAEAVFNAEENLMKSKDPDYVKKTFDSSGITLDDTDNAQFDEKYKAALDRQAKERQAYYDAEKQAMNETLAAYGSFEQKCQAIRDLAEAKKKGKSKEEQDAINKQTNETIAVFEKETNKKIDAFEKLFGDMKTKTVKQMREIAANAKAALNFVEKETWDAEKGKDYGIGEETFKKLQSSEEEREKYKKGIEDLTDQINKCDTAFNKIGEGIKKLFSSESDPKKLNEALILIESGLNEVMQSAQAISGIFSDLGNALGNDTFGKVSEGISTAVDIAGSAMSGAMSGSKAGAMFGPWGAAAGAAIGLVSSLGSSLAKLHDAKHEKSIQKIQDQIEVLEKSYGNLGESLEKAYSADASKLIDQQNTLLAQQKVLIQNQIAEEQSKKKSDKGRIEEWQKQIEEIDKQIAGNKEKQIDAIMGSDVKSAIDDFAQAYADAWAAGDDRAKSSKDLVKQMIKQMVMEAIKATTSQPMEALRQRLAGFFSDGVISAWEREQIEKGAADLTKQLDEQFGWADEYLQGDKEGASSQDSTRGGFESMSQETGSELNGRFTALQISNEEIKNSMLLALGNMSALCTTTSDGNILLSEMRNLALMSNGHLEDIARYTKPILGFGEKLDKIERNTANL